MKKVNRADFNRGKLHVKKGDLVYVLSGDDKGKRGVILKIDKKKERAIVEGMAIHKKHLKARKSNAEVSNSSDKGSIIEREGYIRICKLMLVGKDKVTPSRIGRKLNDNGKLQRYLKSTGEYI